MLLVSGSAIEYACQGLWISSIYTSEYSLIVPRTEIIGDTDRYVKAGSTVALRCVVRGALEPPSYIIWFHGATQIFVDNERGRKIQIDRSTPDGDDDSPSTVSRFEMFFCILTDRILLCPSGWLTNNWGGEKKGLWQLFLHAIQQCPCYNLSAHYKW